MATLMGLAAAAACSGPTTPVPTGFGTGNCGAGTRISGESEMGVTDEGFHTDVDAKIIMTGRAGGSCFGATVDAEDEQ